MHEPVTEVHLVGHRRGQHAAGGLEPGDAVDGVDDLLAVADSKYALVIYSAKRARQINAYYSQLQEGLLDYVGPLVETEIHEKPMSIALREINQGLLTSEPTEV